MNSRTIVINSNCYHGFSVFDAINGAAAAGFRNIEITATRGWTEHVMASMRFEELLRIKDALAQKGMAVPAMSGHSSLASSARLADFRDNIRLAAFFGASVIVTSIGEAHPPEKEGGGESPSLVRNIKSLIPLLEELGMTLAIETHGEHGTGLKVKAVVDAVASNLVKICYDTGNVIFYGNAVGTADLEASAGSVGYLHIKDKAGAPGEWNFPALGRGCVDFPAVFDVLQRSGNPSMASVEIEFTKEGPSSLGEVNAAVAESAAYLRGLGCVL